MQISTFAIILTLTISNAWSKETQGKQVATVTQMQGHAQLFTHPQKTAHSDRSLKNGTMALYEGEYYMVQDAKIGDRVDNGNIVRTLPGAQARVVYDNGDQFSVGPGTAYRITWNKSNDLDAKMELMYGKLRGVISKEGPREKFKIKTRAATMGVRGTDFFIVDVGTAEETEVTVIRGSVEVKANGAEKKASEVKTGMSAAVENKTIELRSTTKEDLGGIQKASTITSPSEPPKTITQEVVAKVEQLEKKAIEVTENDVKKYQPELFKEIEKGLSSIKNAQEISSQLITLVAKNAPSAPAKRHKPNITELQDTDKSDVYDKYFKIGE